MSSATAMSAQLLEMAWPIVCEAALDLLDGYSTLAAMQACRAAQADAAVKHMRRAKELFARVRAYLRSGQVLPPTFEEDDELRFALLPLRPDAGGRCSPNKHRVLQFERDNPELSYKNYCCAICALGLAEEPFWRSIGIRGKSNLSIADLPEDHEELLRILHPEGYYAPEQTHVTSDNIGPVLVVTPPRMAYFGVAFGNFWCALLVHGGRETRVALSAQARCYF